MPKSLVPNQFDYNGVYVEGSRNEFRFHKTHLASFMSGMLVPMGDPIPVFPGVKLDLKANLVVRSNTMVVPPLDGIYIDVFSVWVPHRIVWTSFPQFLGENDTTAWTQTVNLTYPSVSSTYLINNISVSIINVSGQMGDVNASNIFLSPHYGLASKTSLVGGASFFDIPINVLAYRGYYACWNFLFRDENYQRPVLFSKGDVGNTGEFGYFLKDYDLSSSQTLFTKMGASSGTSCGANYALLMPVNKFHDAYTSVLPQPQFGNAVNLIDATNAPIQLSGNTPYSGKIVSTAGVAVTVAAALETNSSGSLIHNSSNVAYDPNGTLVANISTTINQFRTSVMYQRYLEALARGGRRVPEYYDVIYSVKNSTARKDYPEMISHQRYMLGVNQVVATADTSGSGWTSHLGDTGAYSLTNLKSVPICEREFTEFGYLHILYCVRADNRYSQSIPEHFTHQTLMDEYNPYFDHIGDVAVPNYLINMDAISANNFGFQESWWQERTQIGLTVGALNKSYGSLKYWVLGETFDTSLVTCTPGYLCFDPAVFNDLFVSAYYAYPQFILDGLIYGKKAGKMSLHSIPGIVGRI